MSTEAINTFLFFINLAASMCYLIYIVSGLTNRVFRMTGKGNLPVANLLWYWTKWPALASAPLELVVEILLGEPLDWWDYLSFLATVVIWWMYRNDGDDEDHKKLKKKLGEKVADIGGKLVVIPEPA